MTKNKFMKDFLKLLILHKDIASLEKLFDLFFTIEEKNQIISRYSIIKALLTSDMSQREISKKFNVSISQITRGSNALKIINPKLKQTLIKTMQKK